MNVSSIIEYLANLPPALTYLVIGAGAAVENIVPPVPADTFVLLGGFLSARGGANAWLVFFVTWFANVTSALLVYGLARKYGSDFFRRPAAHWLLRPRQLERIAEFYGRWGTPAILLSRFLPAFRAIVPVFAGVTGVSLPRLVIPMAAASGVWYGILVVLGTMAGRNLERILAAVEQASTVLLVIALLLLVLVGRWWWKTRHEHH